MLGMRIRQMLREDPSAVRKAAWSWSFYQYMRVSQLMILFLVVAVVGPPLISQDVRSKSFLMYFSKPITRWDYLLGKAGVLLSFAMSVTLAPALVLYAISIGFSPSLAAFFDTGLIAVRILAAFAVTAVPATLLMLFYSSLTREPRYAAFAWVATCILGELFYLTLVASPTWRDSTWIFLVSPRQIAATALGAVFDVREQVQTLSDTPLAMLSGTVYSETTALLALLGVSIVALLGLLRRVTAPLRV
jgi:ABC-type transport system involved in multi-copper enzyme maturation permease subunit